MRMALQEQALQLQERRIDMTSRRFTEQELRAAAERLYKEDKFGRRSIRYNLEEILHEAKKK